MKKILLIVCLGMFLGIASASAAEGSAAHKTSKSELKVSKAVPHKNVHKAHKNGTRKVSKKSQKTFAVKR